ncbi:MAG: hypothetical protein ACFFDN_22330 [Candidatus Hodarchaeota archaeon]
MRGHQELLLMTLHCVKSKSTLLEKAKMKFLNILITLLILSSLFSCDKSPTESNEPPWLEGKVTYNGAIFGNTYVYLWDDADKIGTPHAYIDQIRVNSEGHYITHKVEIGKQYYLNLFHDVPGSPTYGIHGQEGPFKIKGGKNVVNLKLTRY